jgi:Tol biopolymer transport system component
LAYSQLFFPVKGIIGIYHRATKQYSELQEPMTRNMFKATCLSPDNKKSIICAGNFIYNERIRRSGRALLYAKDVKEFRKGTNLLNLMYIRLISITKRRPICTFARGLSKGKSNYFPKFSPDGKWIVFCQAENFMLLQQDSKLYIMDAKGGTPRLMNCNMKT